MLLSLFSSFKLFPCFSSQLTFTWGGKTHYLCHDQYQYTALRSMLGLSILVIFQGFLIFRRQSSHPQAMCFSIFCIKLPSVWVFPQPGVISRSFNKVMFPHKLALKPLNYLLLSGVKCFKSHQGLFKWIGSAPGKVKIISQSPRDHFDLHSWCSN